MRNATSSATGIGATSNHPGPGLDAGSGWTETSIFENPVTYLASLGLTAILSEPIGAVLADAA